MHNSAIAICCFCFLGFLGAVVPSLLTAPKEHEPIIIYQIETTTTTEETTTTETVTTTTEIILDSASIAPELSEEVPELEEEEVIEDAEEVQEN